MRCAFSVMSLAKTIITPDYSGVDRLFNSLLAINNAWRRISALLGLIPGSAFSIFFLMISKCLFVSPSSVMPAFAGASVCSISDIFTP